jgi:hypothetical protein
METDSENQHFKYVSLAIFVLFEAQDTLYVFKYSKIHTFTSSHIVMLPLYQIVIFSFFLMLFALNSLLYESNILISVFLG